MALSERDRHARYEAARRELGEPAADTLMELLPPVGWADVATKTDVDAGLNALYNRIEALVYRELLREVGGLHAEIGSIRDEIQRQTRTILVSMVGILASAAGLALGIAQLSI
ncbi:MAG: hypothetical protein ABWZ15_00330 [Acidimicrobiia bacterium]